MICIRRVKVKAFVHAPVFISRSYFTQFVVNGTGNLLVSLCAAHLVEFFGLETVTS